jgi:hypothetical protein
MTTTRGLVLGVSQVEELRKLVEQYDRALYSLDREDAGGHLRDEVEFLLTQHEQASCMHAPREINTPEVRQAIAAAITNLPALDFGGAEQAVGAVFTILDRASAGVDLETGK